MERLMTRKDFTDEEYITMEMGVVIAIRDYGWIKEDGTQLTDDELCEWSEEEMIEAFHKLYGEYVKYH